MNFHERCQSVSPELLSLFSGNYILDIQTPLIYQIYIQMLNKKEEKKKVFKSM